MGGAELHIFFACVRRRTAFLCVGDQLQKFVETDSVDGLVVKSVGCTEDGANYYCSNDTLDTVDDALLCSNYLQPQDVLDFSLILGILIGRDLPFDFVAAG